MEKINFNFQKVNREKLVEDLFENPFLNNFFIENDLDSEIVEKYLLDFMTYNTEKNRCLDCNGLNECQQDTKGLEPVIIYRESKVIYNYKECSFLAHKKKQSASKDHIDAMHLPSSILEASFDDFDFTRGENKTEILNKMNTFITRYKMGENPKGMYLWGRNSVGKTYVLSALAKELIKNNINVVIAYYPDLVREFKSRIGDRTVEPLISKLKQVEILMLDDIGGEGNSVWARDEILGPILQYRLLDNKPTFFSSNMPLKALIEEHFAKFTTSKATLRAARIGTRIKSLVEDNEIKM